MLNSIPKLRPVIRSAKRATGTFFSGVGFAWTLTVTNVLLIVAQLALDPTAQHLLSLKNALTFLDLLSYAVVGAIIIFKASGHSIGWLLCLLTFGWALGNVLMEAGEQAIAAGTSVIPTPVAAHAVAVASNGIGLFWFGYWLHDAAFLLTTSFLLLLFPTGRLLSWRWRSAGWLATTCALAASLSGLLAPDASSYDTRIVNAPSALGIKFDPTVEDILTTLPLPLTMIALAACITSLIIRFRRATGVERQQLKWVAYAALPLPLLFLVPFLLPPDNQQVMPLLFALAVVCLPVGMGIAILRYRLYDIDLIINRTIVYALLSLCLLSLYVTVVLVVGSFFEALDNSIVTLIAAGLVAVAFAPLRDRLQRGVNRLMYGERDDPYAVLSRLSHSLEQTLIPEAVMPIIVETIVQALKLPYAAIALKFEDSLEDVAVYGAPSANALLLPIVYQAETLGQLKLASRGPGERFSASDSRLLGDLARQAGIAAHAIRLTADLQRSRERLVTAREEERRRLRRDLHDGLGPQLASLTLKLETARNRMSHDRATDALLANITEQMQSAVADIRRLVYNLRPPALDEFGLLLALQQTVRQYSEGQIVPSFKLETPACLPPLSAAVEVAVYRIAQEAITNVVRHAQARSCVVRLAFDDTKRFLCLEVLDDGIGLSAQHKTGVGLHSMRERAEEIGGSCTIEPAGSEGTRVVTCLPCQNRLPTADTENTARSEKL